MKIKALLLSALLASTSALACEKPAPPSLPDPDSAVTAQMVKAKNELKAFLAAGDTYLECVEGDAQYNAMVEEMQAAAEEFNNIIRKYKKRMTAG